MAIPSYSVIANSEIDPEAPLTSSLFYRLRDNILSLMAIDPATPAPTMNLGDSIYSRRTLIELAVGSSGNLGSSGTHTWTEQIISILSGPSSEAVSVSDLGAYSMGASSGSPRTSYVQVAVKAIQVPYVLLVPQAVEITHFNPLTGAAATVFTSPNDNTWRTMASVSVGMSATLQVKTRVDSTNVYIQFRGNVTSGLNSYIDGGQLVGCRTTYRSKNAATA